MRGNEKLRAEELTPVIREREPDLRRHPRAKVSWPVTVEVGDQRFDLHTLNLSPFGAKVSLAEPPPELGMPAHLRFRPPGGPPLDVEAIVWRHDTDGLAFFFIGVEGERFPVLSEF